MLRQRRDVHNVSRAPCWLRRRSRSPVRRKRSASPRSPRRPPSRSASRWRPEEFSSPEPARTSARGSKRRRTESRQTKLRKHFFGDIYRQGNYVPLHPELFENPRENLKRWLAPSFIAAVSAGGGLKEALREDAPGIYSFELFNSEFCEKLLEEVTHAQQTAREALDRPNGMNRYGVVLNQLGLEPLITELQQEYLMPLMMALYPQEADGCRDHHCFIVRYKAGEDVGLDMHEDDADVTLNVCLGREFAGATLTFCGLVTDANHRKMQYTYSHEKGRAVLHLGRQRHGADDIESGERVNFILWSVSEKYRSSEAYQNHRLRSSSADPPDRICLSYTHDRDYTKFLPKPTKAQAISRGVMLDVVERRLEVYNRPVLDLSRPIDEINSVPSVCLFLEGLPPYRQHQLFQSLMEIAEEVHDSVGKQDGEVPSILFFVAVQPSGAVPQVRELCAVTASPALAILDVDKEQRYRWESDKDLEAPVLRDFVRDFREGKLKAEVIGSPEAEPPAEPMEAMPVEAPSGPSASTSSTGSRSPTEAPRTSCNLL
ncbi:ICU11 [Symbiodinium microadriaticum]|nr:ICU11 [Symbiodinium microadriaticum]